MENNNSSQPRKEGERKMVPNGEPKILAEGKLGAIVQFPMLVDSGKGYEAKMFERFVRPPGTRIIAIQDDTIFLQKEHRLETSNEFDWRLPGGKVVDSFAEYKEYIGKEMPIEKILDAGKRELYEEAHLEAETVELLKKSSCGASVEWDLYYLIATQNKQVEHSHNEGEEIVDGQWFTFNEIKEMCDKGEIDEDRTVAVLYKYINSKSAA
jgi:8-oxo-dGTP pyrophosphatase MutT (NUDIX family)